PVVAGDALGLRNLYLEDVEHGIVARIDSVELDGRRHVPVEAKHGHPPKEPVAWTPPGAAPGEAPLSLPVWPPDAVQLCAEGMVLNANGYPSAYGFVMYRAARRRIRVDFTPELIRATRLVAEAARAAETGPLPPPLVNSPKCLRCSLHSICLPDETNLLRGVLAETPLRRIVPSRDDGGIVYVTEPGTQVGKTGDVLEIRPREGGAVQSLPLVEVAHVAVFGNVTLTAAAVSALLSSGATIGHFSSGGYFLGLTQPFSLRNAATRRAQLDAADDRPRALQIARALMTAKILNQRTLLRRNGAAPPALDALAALAQEAQDAPDTETLLGVEGRAAHVYYGAFPTMLRDAAVADGFTLDGRNRRPPLDPVNALLSFGYAILAREFAAACVHVGLEPTIGFLHAPRPGRPSLALDLMEPYRPLVVDSVVLRILNTAQMGMKHFVRDRGSVLLTPEGRRRFLNAYEYRLAQTIRHPLFGYTISYRRAMEVEVRMLARFLDGDLPAFAPLTTR
ncbi:MAG: CRISPR-associated endonuclease Cas1, partial [Firmicutes bacterium]|nr:CRISPR-associated endonuclease Cas1 [Bacillota bacterium]